ncbi:hypothetical protein BDZ97DRAFT_1867531 [Flammula alnicola]|nr:hypothetical protein BDZ97DRAFT_1867531 [Flammula alnicola]
MYLLRYIEHESNLSLLPINTFQKDVADANPLVRASAQETAGTRSCKLWANLKHVHRESCTTREDVSSAISSSQYTRL